jgi:hypothetical protein
MIFCFLFFEIFLSVLPENSLEGAAGGGCRDGVWGSLELFGGQKVTTGARSQGPGGRSREDFGEEPNEREERRT